MPRQATEPAISTRRSSRLNGSKPDTEGIAKGTSVSGRRSTRSKASTSKPYDRPTGRRSAAAAVAPTPKQQQEASTSSSVSVNLRRSLRISPEELVRREAALLAGEIDLKSRSQALNRATDSLRKKEKDTAKMMSRLADREAQATVSQLDGFLCPLCYEVFSAPHTLNAPNCGHTFCGLCILKWFFSRLHGCGAWHEPVHCPICRTMIQSPRSENSFPFIPNRLATTTIEALTDKLVSITGPANTAMSVKREELNDDIPVASGSKPPQGRNCAIRNTSTKVEDDEDAQTLDVDAWREGGHLRTEWLKKDREGKREMSDLLDSWRGLKPVDMVSLKRRLGV